jgi:hypothetical protein
MFDTRLIFLTVDNERRIEIENEKQNALRGGPRADYSNQSEAGGKNLLAKFGKLINHYQVRKISNRSTEPIVLS